MGFYNGPGARLLPGSHGVRYSRPMRLTRPGASAVAGVVLAALALEACGGGGDRPTAPAAPTAPPVPPAIGPTPEPPVSASCERLPLGSPTYTCRDEGAEFLGEVSDAIDALKVEHPEYFRDGDYVTNLGGYYVGLIRILDRRGSLRRLRRRGARGQENERLLRAVQGPHLLEPDPPGLHGHLLPGVVPPRPVEPGALAPGLQPAAQHRGRLRSARLALPGGRRGRHRRR